MTPKGPIDLRNALSGFDALWSPRIVTRVNDYDPLPDGVDATTGHPL